MEAPEAGRLCPGSLGRAHREAAERGGAEGLRRGREPLPKVMPVVTTVGDAVPVAVNEGAFALSRVLLPEPDNLPPTETHKQTASSLRLTAAEAVPVACVDTLRNCRVVDVDVL